MFLQDGDPSQNSKKTKDAFDAVGARKFSIQPRSPDINPIEKIFHQMKCQLNSDAIEENMQQESFKKFSGRMKKTMENFPTSIIDKTIDSMDKRIGLIIKSKGQRTKY